MWPRVALLLALVLVVAGLAVAWSIARDVAALARTGPGTRPPSITLQDAEGGTLARLGSGFGERLGLDEMPAHLPLAVLAVEDRRFFSHPGLDLRGILRASWRNLLAGRVVEGGSTITQQLAKLALTGPERSLGRKLREAPLALWLELTMEKQAILEAYLNRVYLGAGTFGVDGAARHYFGRSARELSLAQSAMLAGLIRAPSRLAPTRDLETAQARAGVVLDSMVAAGFVPAADAARAKAQPAVAVAGRGGYFADWVAAEARATATGGAAELVVRTTLEPRLQALAERAVAAVLDEDGRGRGASQAALVALAPDGRVRAMVGGRAHAASPFNRAVQARRQPGSAFKLFVFLAALEAGWRPDDRISAAPLTIGGWQPRNDDGAYPPSVSLREAFARSINTAAVRLAEQVGRPRVVALARRLGITGALPDAASLALGSGETSLLELTAAYASVAAGGRLVWPRGVAGGGAADDRLLRSETAAAMAELLAAAVREGTGRRADPGRPVAGKTGTSSGFRDAWFIGFTDGLVVGVWVGNDDGSPMQGVTGGTLPAEIFKRFLTPALQATPGKPLR